MEELKRCPFCGGEAKTSFVFGRAGVVCMNCDANIRMCLDSSMEDAVKAWNTRKPVDDVLERLEEELNFADTEKKRCAKENLLQFDSAKGCAQGLYNAIKIIKEGLM